MGKHKRKIALLLVTVLLFICSLLGCNHANAEKNSDGLTVTYINVGNGDCIFIKLPDQKTMLIDAGIKNQNNLHAIKKVLSSNHVKQIDYLVLTHPDVDHVGNASAIISEIAVNRAYIPKIKNRELYPSFDKAVTELEKINAEIIFSTKYMQIQTSSYSIGFLSPFCEDKRWSDPYDHFNLLEQPTDSDINNLSPIIYLESYGRRFLFTGDADASQERAVMEHYYAGIYKFAFDFTLKLQNIDVLKVAHHGSDDSSCSEFLNTITPRMAIISSGQNSYGHPSSQVINRLNVSNSNIRILRTDSHGNISVSVDKKGQLDIDLS